MLWTFRKTDCRMNEHSVLRYNEAICLKLIFCSEQQLFPGALEGQLRTALFWAIMQRVVVISYRRFGTTYRTHLQRSRYFFLILEDGTEKLSRNVGKKLPLLTA